MADRNGYIGRAPGDSSVVVSRQIFNPTGVTTDFTFASGYTVGYLDLYLNGTRLIEGPDYGATDGSTISLVSPAGNGDVLEGVAYKAFNLGDAHRVGVQSSGILIGNAEILNFVGTGNTFAVNGPIIDVSIQGGGGGSSVASTITVADESSDTTCFPVFVTAASGDLNPKSGSNLTFNSSNGTLSATTFNGAVTGDVTGTASLASNLTGTPDITVRNITGVAATFTGNVSIGGTLTYEDVTNVDSIGIVTARGGIELGVAGVGGTFSATGFGSLEGGLNVAGIVTAAALAGFDYLQAPFSSRVDFTVTVASKTAAHRYNGTGSGNGYLIDGVEAPFLTLTPGRTYRFVHDNTGSHPLKFYLEADKTTLYSTGVTFDNAYTEIAVSDSTPQVLHYQCTNHGYMGNAVNTNSNVAATQSASISTEAATPSNAVVSLNLSNAQDHKVTATGICTITTTADGTEGESHTVRIINSGIATVGFSTYFLFPSGSAPSMPTADGAISLISFTVHDSVGAGCTQLLAGASVNYS